MSAHWELLRVAEQHRCIKVAQVPLIAQLPHTAQGMLAVFEVVAFVHSRRCVLVLMHIEHGQDASCPCSMCVTNGANIGQQGATHSCADSTHNCFHACNCRWLENGWYATGSMRELGLDEHTYQLGNQLSNISLVMVSYYDQEVRRYRAVQRVALNPNGRAAAAVVAAEAVFEL